MKAESRFPLGAGAGSSFRRSFEKADQVANPVVPMLGVAKRKLVVDLVDVAASVAALRQVPGLLEVADDLRRCSFGDVNGEGDVSEPHVRIAGDARQHVPVIGDEAPGVLRFRRHGEII